MTPSAKQIRVYVDSDVIVSSLISKSGAAFALIYYEELAALYISNFSISELNRVVKRLKIEPSELNNVISTQFTTVKISQSYNNVKAAFANYVTDPDDAHIVAGAKKSEVSFLVTYNVRHFNSEKLRKDYQIVLLTPGLFMQYLRSLNY